MDLLKLFKLDGFADQLAENLPYGKQRLFGDRTCTGDRYEAASS